MIVFRTNYSEPTDRNCKLVGSELRAWIERMNKGEFTLHDLRAERVKTAKRLEELDMAIRVMESLDSSVSHRVSRPTESLSVGANEFAFSGIAEAAVMVLKRAQKPLHASEILDALKAGGYIFKGANPLNSVAPVLHIAAQNKKHGLVSKGKNTYSLKEVGLSSVNQQKE